MNPGGTCGAHFLAIAPPRRRRRSGTYFGFRRRSTNSAIRTRQQSGPTGSLRSRAAHASASLHLLYATRCTESTCWAPSRRLRPWRSRFASAPRRRRPRSPRCGSRALLGEVDVDGAGRHAVAHRAGGSVRCRRRAGEDHRVEGALVNHQVRLQAARSLRCSYRAPGDLGATGQLGLERRERRRAEIGVDDAGQPRANCVRQRRAEMRRAAADVERRSARSRRRADPVRLVHRRRPPRRRRRQPRPTTRLASAGAADGLPRTPAASTRACRAAADARRRGARASRRRCDEGRRGAGGRAPRTRTSLATSRGVFTPSAFTLAASRASAAALRCRCFTLRRTVKLRPGRTNAAIVGATRTAVGRAAPAHVAAAVRRRRRRWFPSSATTTAGIFARSPAARRRRAGGGRPRRFGRRSAGRAADQVGTAPRRARPPSLRAGRARRRTRQARGRRAPACGRRRRAAARWARAAAAALGALLAEGVAAGALGDGEAASMLPVLALRVAISRAAAALGVCARRSNEDAATPSPRSPAARARCGAWGWWWRTTRTRSAWRLLDAHGRRGRYGAQSSSRASSSRATARGAAGAGARRPPMGSGAARGASASTACSATCRARATARAEGRACCRAGRRRRQRAARRRSWRSLSAASSCSRRRAALRSTCSLNPIEDEAVVAALLGRAAASAVELEAWPADAQRCGGAPSCAASGRRPRRRRRRRRRRGGGAALVAARLRTRSRRADARPLAVAAGRLHRRATRSLVLRSRVCHLRHRCR